MLLFTRKPRVGWEETGFRRFFLSRFLIFAAARLHWPRDLLARATWREKRYLTSPFHLLTISYLSLYLALRVSTSWHLLPESEQVLQKKTAPEAIFKINIWKASIKLVWRVCFICVFCSCRTNAGIFYSLCKGTTFKKIFLCFRRVLGAMQQEWTGGGGTRLIFGYRFEILTLFRTKNSLNSYPV